MEKLNNKTKDDFDKKELKRKSFAYLNLYNKGWSFTALEDEECIDDCLDSIIEANKLKPKQ